MTTKRKPAPAETPQPEPPKTRAEVLALLLERLQWAATSPQRAYDEARAKIAAGEHASSQIAQYGHALAEADYKKDAYETAIRALTREENPYPIRATLNEIAKRAFYDMHRNLGSFGGSFANLMTEKAHAEAAKDVVRMALSLASYVTPLLKGLPVEEGQIDDYVDHPMLDPGFRRGLVESGVFWGIG